MDPKALAALAMEGGQFAAMEGLDPSVAEWIKKVIEAMAGGGAPESEAPAREDNPDDPGAPAMREEDLPPQMRKLFRSMRTASALTLRDSIRLRLHTARTVDGIVLDAATEKDLAAATSVEQFEREFRLVTRQAARGAEQQRNRSGALPPDNKGDENALRYDDLIEEGLPAQQARELVELSKKSRVSADAELEGARIRLRTAKNGGA
jgi:hypothetical protein